MYFCLPHIIFFLRKYGKLNISKNYSLAIDALLKIPDIEINNLPNVRNIHWRFNIKIKNDKYTIVQKFGVSNFLKEINTFFLQGCIKLIKPDKYIYNVTKYFYFK